MDEKELHRRVREQFSYQGDSAEIWEAFDLFLNTNEFLNLGYSKWYQPHFIGSSQLRLVRKIGEEIAEIRGGTDGVSLLDIGCGRGGSSIHLSEYGFSTVGLDLVPYNIEQARLNATTRGSRTDFVIGDAMNIPFKRDSFEVATAVDSIVYFEDKQVFFNELSRVLRPGGITAISDLVLNNSIDQEEREIANSFAESWDMAPPVTFERYKQCVRDNGFNILRTHDISKNSTNRFGKWARLFLSLERSPLNGFLERILDNQGVDLDSVTYQVREAYRALPFLRHVIVYARNNKH